jgi:hypothetical protein
VGSEEVEEVDRETSRRMTRAMLIKTMVDRSRKLSLRRSI